MGALIGTDRELAIGLIRDHHYTHSVSSGKSYYFRFGDAVIAWSIPANKNIGRYLLGRAGVVWELSRLWAPDGHDDNLLTQAIAYSIRQLRIAEPACVAGVSYADPNVGHEGFIYRAASWVYCGQCEESRCYRGPTGEVVARRKFHSGSRGLRKAEIEALGFVQLKLPGKHRYAKGLRKWSRKAISKKFGAVPLLKTTTKEREK